MFFASGKNKDIVQRLTTYGNQQVVVNWYEDEQLLARDGFFFSHIQIEDGFLFFMKDQLVKQKFQLANYKTIEILPDFRDFYQLTNETKVLQIYFPH